MTEHPQRKVVLIDREVQGGLQRKAAWYWLLSLGVVGSLNVLGWIFVAPGIDVLVRIRELLPSFFGVLFVATLSSLIVLPVVLYGLAKHTNRFAGPIYRLQRNMKALAEGKATPPLSFREGDYWHELAEVFNQVAARLEAAETAAISKCTDEFGSYEPTDVEEISAAI